MIVTANGPMVADRGVKQARRYVSVDSSAKTAAARTARRNIRQLLNNAVDFEDTALIGRAALTGWDVS